MIQFRGKLFCFTCKSFEMSRSYVRGVRHRIPAARSQIEENFQEAFVNDDDPDDIGALEGDFNTLQNSYKQHERETAEYKEKLRNWTVGQKYFKRKSLNFLTWNEKEKIRFLHNEDPVEWSAERLSDSFPAEFETILRIIKANWQPRNERRIHKHDLGVNENWKQFRENKLNDLDPMLKKHLEKFSMRSLATSKFVETNLEFRRLPVPKTTEFLDIIKSCKTGQNLSADIKSKPPLQLNKRNPSKVENLLIGKIKDQRHITFSQLNPQLKVEATNTKAAAIANPSSDAIDIAGSDLEELKFQRKDLKKIASEDEQLKELSMPAIRETIIIPRRLYKEGATYRLADCFYDDDGEFLYRVPGMTREKY